MAKKRKFSNPVTGEKPRIAPAPGIEPAFSTLEAVQLRSEPRPSEEAPNDAVSLNFRVSASFRRNFRLYAVAHDLKLNELLPLAFEALRKATP